MRDGTGWQARIGGVYSNVSASTGAPTADQKRQIAALSQFAKELQGKVAR